jgi:glycosyltransferase involved in cell wall biosynthesis
MWEEARYLASAGYEVIFVSAGYPGAPKAETLDGIHVVRVGGIHWLWWRTFLYYVTRGRGRFDVVVAEGFGGSRIPRLAPLYVKEPIITEWHQVHRNLFAVQYPRMLNGPLNLLERVTARVHRDTLVRAGTEEVREAFVGIGFKRENVFVLPVSIREEWITTSPSSTPPSPTLPLAGGGGTAASTLSPVGRGGSILWLGKLRRYKCPDHAVRAMVEVVKRVPHSRLILAIRQDDQKYERQLHALVGELGLEDHVEFRINVSEQEKRDLLRSVRVLVVPSAVEGFGIVVLEANACGVPVVASTGVPEGAVEEGVNGLRYPFGDIKALAARIVELLQDDAVHSRLSQNGLERVACFGWSRIGAQFERVVRQAVAG